MPSRHQSHQIYQYLCTLIPGGVNSPVRSFKSVGQMPMVVDHAYQDQLVDADGRTYIDYCGSWGALIHGHAHPAILEGVSKRMAKGTSFGITTELEGVLAAEIIAAIDSLEKIRFVSSGTEATMSAVRLARGFTHRDYIVKFSGNYHGHADFFLVEGGSGLLDVSSTASSAGVPKEIAKYTLCLPYNDLGAVQRLFSSNYASEIAAVIVEPIAGNMGVIPGHRSFLQLLREETSKKGTLLIFDEVITGFRVARGGAQGLYGISPDLTCFGKVIGGGFPVAAFGGRGEIMDHLAPLGAVYQAGTLSGNPLAMEAGLQSLHLLKQPDFYENLAKKTARLVNPIKERIREKEWKACIQQEGSMFTLFFGKKEVLNLKQAQEVNTDLFARLFRTLFAQGIYIPPSPHEAWFVSSAHQEKNLEKTREAILAFMEEAQGELI